MANPGVVPRAIQDVFDTIEKTPDRDFLLRMSMMEIYNEVELLSCLHLALTPCISLFGVLRALLQYGHMHTLFSESTDMQHLAAVIHSCVTFLVAWQWCSPETCSLFHASAETVACINECCSCAICLTEPMPHIPAVGSHSIDICALIETIPCTVAGLAVANMLPQMVQVLNDLLDPARANLKLREDPKRGFYVEGIKEETLVSAEHALSVIATGVAHRKV